MAPFYLRVRNGLRHKFKTPLSNQFVYCCCAAPSLGKMFIVIWRTTPVLKRKLLFYCWLSRWSRNCFQQHLSSEDVASCEDVCVLDSSGRWKWKKPKCYIKRLEESLSRTSRIVGWFYTFQCWEILRAWLFRLRMSFNGKKSSELMHPNYVECCSITLRRMI